MINDHSKYKEWEFVYDLKKDKTVVGAAAVNAQQNVQQQMQQNQNGRMGRSETVRLAAIHRARSPVQFHSYEFQRTPATPAAPTTPPPSQ